MCIRHESKCVCVFQASDIFHQSLSSVSPDSKFPIISHFCLSRRRILIECVGFRSHIDLSVWPPGQSMPVNVHVYTRGHVTLWNPQSSRYRPLNPEAGNLLCQGFFPTYLFLTFYSPPLSLCVWCMFICMFAHTWAHMCACTYRSPKCCQESSLISHPPYSLKQNLSMKPRAHEYEFGFRRQPAVRISTLCLPRLKFR